MRAMYMLSLYEKLSTRIHLPDFFRFSIVWFMCDPHNNENSRKGGNKIGFMMYCTPSCVNVTTSNTTSNMSVNEGCIHVLVFFIEYMCLILRIELFLCFLKLYPLTYNFCGDNGIYCKLNTDITSIL